MIFGSHKTHKLQTFIENIFLCPFLFLFLYRYERLMSFFVSARLCVSDAMRKDLRKNWGVKLVLSYL